MLLLSRLLSLATPGTAARPLYLSILKQHYRLKQHTEGQPLTPRLALHAHCLEFINRQKQKIAIQAPYHKYFSTLVKKLTRYASVASPTASMRL
jgi:hypothetical protein